MLLLQLFYLLHREEGAAAGWGLLRVAPPPLLKAVRMATSHVQAQVLFVPSAEVAVLTGKGFGSYGHREMLAPMQPSRRPQGSLAESHEHAWTNIAVPSDGLEQKGPPSHIQPSYKGPFSRSPS